MAPTESVPRNPKVYLYLHFTVTHLKHQFIAEGPEPAARPGFKAKAGRG